MGIIAFDFSMNKPAMATYFNDELELYIFPMNIDDNTKQLFQDCGVKVYSRDLPAVHNTGLNEHELILEHVKRASDLADLIVKAILDVLKRNKVSDKTNVVVANEGFAFSAKGDASLDLSGYKYILMYKLMQEGFTNFKTYSPITIKATAGCAKRGMGKKDMIESIANEDTEKHPFLYVIEHSPQSLKKKTNYVMCVDDLADAYWCLKTVIAKEKLDCKL